MSDAVLTVRLPGCPGVYCLTVDGAGRIAAIAPGEDSPSGWLSPAGIDLQINGGLGLAFPDLQPGDETKLAAIGDWLWQQGVEGYLPTLVTASLEDISRSLAVLAAFQTMDKAPRRARILGVHLEGPCLAPPKRGAHPEQHLQPLTVPVLEQLIGPHADLVRIVTLAPELDPSGPAVPWLRQRGIVISLGHSLATEAEARVAFAGGATMVTHAFNAMPPLHHRETGLLGAALTTPGVRCGVIADGEHIGRTMLSLLLRAGQGCEHLFLVSDALAPLGLPDGRYPWDERMMTVTNGTCRLEDGTLSGTTRPLLDGALNLADWGLCDPETAIALATLAPRQAMGWAAPTRPEDYLDRCLGDLLHWTWDGSRLAWTRADQWA